MYTHIYPLNAPHKLFATPHQMMNVLAHQKYILNQSITLDIDLYHDLNHKPPKLW